MTIVKMVKIVKKIGNQRRAARFSCWSRPMTWFMTTTNSRNCRIREYPLSATHFRITTTIIIISLSRDRNRRIWSSARCWRSSGRSSSRSSIGTGSGTGKTKIMNRESAKNLLTRRSFSHYNSKMLINSSLSCNSSNNNR